MDGFIYIAWLPEFMASAANTYKLGATRNPTQRLQSYPKGTVLVFMEMCHNTFDREAELLDLFRTKFHQRPDLGNAFFDGDCQEMKATVFQHLSHPTVPSVSRQNRKPMDSDVAILHFVDANRAKLCASTSASDELYAKFLDFVDMSGWFVTTKHAHFTHRIVRLVGATTSVGHIDGEPTRVVTFPYLTPSPPTQPLRHPRPIHLFLAELITAPEASKEWTIRNSSAALTQRFKAQFPDVHITTGGLGMVLSEVPGITRVGGSARGRVIHRRQVRDFLLREGIEVPVLQGPAI